MTREPGTDPLGRQSDGAKHPPRSVVPIPALGHDDLRGQRVIVGLPGMGWRHDLRADEKVVQGSRTYVPVMSEHEWYKAELEQIEVFAPLIPSDRVWVETFGSARSSDGLHEEGSGLVSLDGPPSRRPIAVQGALRVIGQRLVQLIDDVERRDIRAVTEKYLNDVGEVCLHVATEIEWYRWTWTGKPPKTLELPVGSIWLE
jgi:hypothetical protein